MPSPATCTGNAVALRESYDVSWAPGARRVLVVHRAGDPVDQVQEPLGPPYGPSVGRGAVVPDDQHVSLARRGVWMKLVLAGVAVLAVGCGLMPSSQSVQLLTGSPPPIGSGGCFTNSASGQLVVDPKYGTAIINDDVQATFPVTVAWRPGFTARHFGSEVEVLDPQGNVVAVTGRSYRIAGGYVDWPGLSVHLFWACDFVNAS